MSNKRRNYTSYGGPRANAAAGIAARNFEHLRQSAGSSYHIGGNPSFATSGGNL